MKFSLHDRWWKSRHKYRLPEIWQTLYRAVLLLKFFSWCYSHKIQSSSQYGHWNENEIHKIYHPTEAKRREPVGNRFIFMAFLEHAFYGDGKNHCARKVKCPVNDVYFELFTTRTQFDDKVWTKLKAIILMQLKLVDVYRKRPDNN